MKAKCRTTYTHGDEESDESIVPKKQSNKGCESLAETVEGREAPKRNASGTTVGRPQVRNNASSGLERIHKRAVQEKNSTFNNLFSHLTTELLRDSFCELKRNAAVGIDPTTWHEYQKNLDARIDDLHERLHRGSYRATPSRRSYLKKDDGKLRPLGISSIEDKIVQQATATILNQIYEADFLGYNYGFRKGRKQHDALDALAVAIQRNKVSWILDADISGFFDNLDHDWLMRFIQHRVTDRRMLRLLEKWLKCGYIENGRRYPQEKGTPQGSVISPLLSNIYLHYVLDMWVEQWRGRHAHGKVSFVRFADDFVVSFQSGLDAKAFKPALSERMAEFCLCLHPEKTRLIQFGRFAREDRKKAGLGKPETFDFLGFTHICDQNRKGGFFLRRLTKKKRMKKKLKEVQKELTKRMHRPVKETGMWLRSVLIGHQNYYGVPGNRSRLNDFYTHVVKYWRRTLSGRSQNGKWTWEKFGRTRDWLLPRLKPVHPFPDKRFDVRLKGGAV